MTRVRIGDSENNSFTGFYDSLDFIFGRGGNDQIYGDGRGDQLFGGAGRDLILSFVVPDGGAHLYGGTGRDHLVGGENDIMTGGKGSDLFDIDVGDTGTVTITDYNPTQDRLQLGAGSDADKIAEVDRDTGIVYVGKDREAVFQIDPHTELGKIKWIDLDL